MRIILAGNPNCGKTTLFNALTRSNAKTGNWHGVTVGERCKKTRIAGQEATVCDLPGIYSLLTHSLEERVSKRAIEEEEYDLVVAVADAVTLSRSIKLPLEIAARGKKTILVVTMADLLKKRGGYLDAEKLSARLGIPVVTADARSKRDIRRLQQKIAETCGKETPAFSPVRKEEALEGVYSAGSEKSGIADFVLYNPVTAYALFALIMLSVFFLAFGNHMPGVFLKNKTEYLIGDVLGGGAVSLLERVGAHPAILSLVKDALFGGAAMLLSFVPQIVIVQAALIVLEESGYMASLAFMTDGIFSKVGLSGRAAFSILMGFGCSAAAILTTRGLEDKKIQKRTVLILPYISCSAKMPVYLTLISAFFTHKFRALCAIYFAGVLFSLFAALLLKKIYGGETEFVLEIPHLQPPRLSLLLKSLLFYVKQFIMKIATVVTAFLIVMWFFLSFDFTFHFVGQGSETCILRYLCEGLKFLFYPMGIFDWRVALSAVSGLVAKESVAGMLGMFYGTDLSAAMTPAAALAFIVFIMTCSPCVSAIAATAREFGKRAAIKYALAQTGIAFLAAYLTYFMLAYGTFAVWLVPVAAVALLFFTGRKKRGKKRKKLEKIHGKRKTNSENLHG